MEKVNKKYPHTHPADIADIMRVLRNAKERLALFQSLDTETAALTLRELDPENESQLIDELSVKHLSDLLEELPSDDATDIIGELSESKQKQILQLMPDKESKEVKKLLQYKDDTAGGIMTTNFVAMKAKKTAADAIRQLREKTEIDYIPYIFLIDEKGCFFGAVHKSQLVASVGQKSLSDLRVEDLRSVGVETDQEEAAKIVAKYNMLALPVVDKNKTLVGVITVDDVIDVIQEEATEDIYRLAGIEDEDLLDETAIRSAAIRLPWLVTTLIGGLLSCFLIRFFEFAIKETIALAFFVPIITGMGGNIGIQSSTLVVRGIATGRLIVTRMWVTVLKEIRVGMMMGIVCGLIVGIIAFWLEGTPNLGFVVGISMFFAIVVAAMTGSFVPMILRKFKIDPAIASGPFITTANDISGLLIYFSLANVLFKFLR